MNGSDKIIYFHKEGKTPVQNLLVHLPGVIGEAKQANGLIEIYWMMIQCSRILLNAPISILKVSKKNSVGPEMLN